ncbi:MAG: alpha-mannosidase [Candidatus Hodarchaeota archaeon]
MPEKKKIIITPETHWDREWYLPFQEYRAKLVILFDKLLDICKNDPEFKNFTLDGQTIPLEDYLEVRPRRKTELTQYIQEGRISIGPFYILPDEFIISGESMIRNLLIGRKISRKFGVEPMNAGYIPDPFGHFAQMPQILSGFNIPSILFARGFDDSFKKLGLNMEFTWEAPGKAAEIIGIHLVRHYGNVANLNTHKDPETGLYKAALQRIYMMYKEISYYCITNAVLLNNGSDHLMAQPEVPEMVKQWNELHGDEGTLEQADFAKYTQLVIDDIEKKNLTLKRYQGELHGGAYSQLLSGVFSARMWIKKWNDLCENRLSRYTEPLSTLVWMHDSSVPDERDFILIGWKWLIKNHPHDSICGCSVDYVHDVDMKTRFGWSEQIAMDIFKNSAIQLTDLMPVETNEGEKFPIFVYNPSPRARSSIVSVSVQLDEKMLNIFPPSAFTITDKDGNQVFSFPADEEMEDRYTNVNLMFFSLNFLARDVPAFGIKTYYILPGEEQEITPDGMPKKVSVGEDSIENDFYKVTVNQDGSFDVLDKEIGVTYKNQGILEDVGDWGDEYDFSWAKEDQQDNRILSSDQECEVEIMGFGNLATIHVYHELELPISLADDRKARSVDLIINPIDVFISLNPAEKIIYIDCVIENTSEDHRLRMLFSSGLKTDQVDADGHFYVVPRPVDLRKVEGWSQDPVPTKHQHNFVSASDGENSLTVFNFGLPEYAPLRKEDGTVDLAVTLVRSVGWLSRGDFATRNGNAGPDLSTPGAQCLGINECNLGITTGKGNWYFSNAHIRADEFNNPLQVISPMSLTQSMRQLDVFKLGVNLDTMSKKETSLELDFAGCELSGDAFLISSFKRAENHDDKVIIRLVNMSSAAETGSLILSKKVKSAEIVALSEESKGAEKVKASIKAVTGSKIEFSAEPHVILTLLIAFE